MYRIVLKTQPIKVVGAQRVIDNRQKLFPRFPFLPLHEHETSIEIQHIILHPEPVCKAQTPSTTTKTKVEDSLPPMVTSFPPSTLSPFLLACPCAKIVDTNFFLQVSPLFPEGRSTMARPSRKERGTPSNIYLPRLYSTSTLRTKRNACW